MAQATVWVVALEAGSLMARGRLAAIQGSSDQELDKTLGIGLSQVT